MLSFTVFAFRVLFVQQYMVNAQCNHRPNSLPGLKLLVYEDLVYEALDD